MNSVIFGGGGFLGSHLCAELLNAGHKVRVFEMDNSKKLNFRHLINKIDWLKGDFTNPNDITNALVDADLVFHLVSTTLPKTSNDNPVHDIQSNLISTLHMLEMARKGRVSKIIFFSSGGTVYGIPKQIPVSESHLNEPISSYGIHKLAIEKYLHLYYHLYGLNYSILRISNPFGPGQSPYGSQGVIAVFINRALKQEPIEVWGDGSVVRDYIYVKDVMRAVLAVLHYSGDEKVFNIGSGEGRSLLEIIKVLEDLIGHYLEVYCQPSRSLDVPVNILDISKAKKELLWKPETNFIEGLSFTLDYVKEFLKDRAINGNQ